MDEIVESYSYSFSEQEESYYINDLNYLLKTFEQHLQEKTPKSNSKKILEGSMICEYMLNLLLKKESILIKNNASFSKLIKFSTDKKIIPHECGKFLDTILIYRNNVNHDLETPPELTLTFLNAFMYYITWFNDYYSDKYGCKKQFKIEKSCSMIKSMKGHDERFKFYNHDIAAKTINPNHIKSIQITLDGLPNKEKNQNIINRPPKDMEIFPKNPPIYEDENKKNEQKQSIVETKISKIKYKLSNLEKKKIENKKEEKIENSHLKKSNHLNTIHEDLILKLLDQQNDSMKKILEVVLENLEITKNIDSKIDNITNALNKIQSHTEKLIKNAMSEEEIDRIIQVHTTECVENILEHEKEMITDNQYNEEKLNLIELFEDNAWNKLSEESKTFLITSKYLYHKLITLDEIIDYSGICVLVTKALEVEIFKRFFADFLKYLDIHYQKDYSQYPTALLFQHMRPLYPERFTMGNIAFVLCYKENKFDTDEQKSNNKSKLIEYCENCVFSKYGADEIEKLLYDYASSIEDIRIKYRNPSAHRNQIERVNAEECMDLVIDVEKLLKNMLESFDK